MGLSSKTTKTNSKESATSKPILNPITQAPVNNYYNRVNGLFQHGDPSDFFAPANPLQEQAFGTDLTSGNGIANYGAQHAANTINLNNVPFNPAQTTQAQAPNRGLLGATYGDPVTVDRVDASGYRPMTSDYQSTASGGGIQEVDATEYIEGFYNPARDDVLRASLGDYDIDAKKRQAAFEAQSAANGAFGGSGYALASGELGAGLTRGRGALSAGIRRDIHNDAVQAALAQAGLVNQGRIAADTNATQASIARDRTNADVNLANLGFQNNFLRDQYLGDQTVNLANAGYASDARNRQFDADVGDARTIYGTEADIGLFNADQANTNSRFNSAQESDVAATNMGLDLQGAGLLADIGLGLNQDARANQQSLLNTGSEMERLQLAEQLAPYTQAGVMGDLIDPSLLAILTGQQVDSTASGTSKQSGGLLGDILIAAAGGAAQGFAASERRVKRDIELVDRLDDGLGWYRFNYVWDEPDEPVREGTMVDEVERLRPWALGPVVDGVRTVDYGAL